MKWLLFILRWFSRLTGFMVMGILILFILGEGVKCLSLTEGIMFLFFPLSVALGFVIALRWEIIGGIVSIAGLIIFYILNLIMVGQLPKGPFFILFTVPAVTFIISGLLSEK